MLKYELKKALKEANDTIDILRKNYTSLEEDNKSVIDANDRLYKQLEEALKANSNFEKEYSKVVSKLSTAWKVMDKLVNQGEYE